jgi:DNA polymerase-3 subunit delta
VEWETLKSTHWLNKWLDAHPQTSRMIDYRLPQGRAMIDWVLQAVKQQKGQFTPQAAAELVNHVGSNTRQASQEIQKLLTYVNYQRPVDHDDVMLLVAQAGEVDVFAMVDALGKRNAKTAVKMVQALLEKQDAIVVLSLVTRHFRLLLMVREVIEEGGGPLVVTEHLGRQPFGITSKFYAEKLWGQARQFTIVQLEKAFRQLVWIDEALKTSQMDGNTAFTTFIAELTAEQ